MDINNNLLINYSVIEKNQRRNQKYLETNENTSTTYQNIQDAAKSDSKREIHRTTALSQETREISSKQFNFTPKGTTKIRKNKAQS